MSDVLISADGLADLLDARAAKPALLDVRWSLAGAPGHEQFLAGHIPGARFVDLERELSAPPGPRGRHPLPEAVEFEAAMRRAGVGDGVRVVVYDGGDPGPAARAWWLLRYFGHDRVVVLDGGIRAWIDSGRPLQSGETAALESGRETFTARPDGMPVLDAAGAADTARRGVLLDARSAARFRGESEPIDPVAGHIPGAQNLPAAATIDDAGRLRSPAALRAVFDHLGIRPANPVGAYCGSGVTAAHLVLALEHAGLQGSLYAGSWSEWITDPNRPVAADPA